MEFESCNHNDVEAIKLGVKSPGRLAELSPAPGDRWRIIDEAFHLY
jgi:hypothetical protein